jgi:hypothetical protein
MNLLSGKAKVQKLAKTEVLMVNIGSTATGGKVLAVKQDLVSNQESTEEEPFILLVSTLTLSVIIFYSIALLFLHL